MEDRKLAAIIFTDIVGFSQKMSVDENLALQLLDTHNDILDHSIERFQGRILKRMGDAIFAEFESANNAVNCAIDIQTKLTDYNTDKPTKYLIAIRIGIHLGDVVIRGDDLFGDGINIASRLEPLAEPGGICITQAVYQSVKAHIEIKPELIGEVKLKNIEDKQIIYKFPSFYPDKVAVSKVKVKAAKSSWLMASSVIVLGIASLIWWSVQKTNNNDMPKSVTQEQEGASIAVLPFVNMSSDPEQEYFSDGISEEILNVLAKIPNLHVTSRSSAFAFKGKALDLTKVAKQLGVNHILEGSVRKSGTTVRITAQLIEAGSDRHLWSKTYDRELTDVFAIQDELADAIVAVLKIKLMVNSLVVKDVVHKVSPEAHTAYLKGLYYFYNAKNDDEMEASLKYFDDAIKLDNNYAIALAYRGLVLNILTKIAIISLTEGPQIARMDIDRAIEIDPELAIAYVHRGLNKLWFDFDFKGSRLDFELAEYLNPNIAQIYANLSSLHSMQGNHQQALLYAHKAKSLNPMDWLVVYLLSEAYFFQGDYQQALVEIENALTFLPDREGMLILKARVELLKGDNEQAILTIKKARIGGARAMIQSMAYSKMGDKTKSDEAMATFIKLSAAHSAYQIAEAYCFRGDIEQCLDWLDLAHKQKDPGLVRIIISPFLKPVYQEKRYKKLVLKMDIL